MRWLFCAQILTVTCEHPTYLSVKRFQRTMTTFLNLLLRRHAPCRLRELYMNSLAIERYWRYEGTRHKFLVSLSRSVLTRGFYRLQRSCGGVMFLHLSVILSTGGGLPQ